MILILQVDQKETFSLLLILTDAVIRQKLFDSKSLDFKI